MNKVFIKDIIDEIEKIAPISWQESYDNSGLLLGRVDKICNGVFVCLDLTLESLDKAIENKCNLIISHHPFIFNPIKQIDFSTVRGKIIEIAIKNDITIYSSHTNIDASYQGVNGILAEKIGIIDLSPLVNTEKSEEENYLGSGAIGFLPKEMDKDEFFLHLKSILNIKSIRYNSNQRRKIKKVALCGGAGSFLIEEAIKNKADIFITGDLKYHDFIETEPYILLADIGHYEGEQFIKERIISIISRKFCNFAPLIPDNSTNRVNYF